jgi:hypothetical protein
MRDNKPSKICHQMVKDRYAMNDPENARHADLAASFMFNFWNATGLLPMVQATLIYGMQTGAADSAD